MAIRRSKRLARRLISAYINHGTMGKACCEVGVSTRTFFRWQDLDPWFKELVDGAKQTISENKCTESKERRKHSQRGGNPEERLCHECRKKKLAKFFDCDDTGTMKTICIECCFNKPIDDLIRRPAPPGSGYKGYLGLYGDRA